jgi:hypothetical protein
MKILTLLVLLLLGLQLCAQSNLISIQMFQPSWLSAGLLVTVNICQAKKRVATSVSSLNGIGIPYFI